MKKGYLFVIILLVFIGSVYAQSISLDWIGMHGSEGTTDFGAEAGEQISVKVQYDPVLMESILGPYFSSTNLDKVRLYWYSSSVPSSGTYISSVGINISGFTYTGVTGTDKTAEFSFTMPTIVTGAQSFQLMLGFYGEDGDFNIYNAQRYSSHFAISGSYPLTSGSPEAGWQSYLETVIDNSTEAPVLTTPSSTTIPTYDNSSLGISYSLTEAALANSVKLYFSTNSDGSSPSTTIELSSAHEAVGARTFEINASSISTSDSDIDSVTGASSLTNGTTYYVAIGYRDISGNTEAVSDWNILQYDTSINRPSSLVVLDGSGSDISISFNLDEQSIDDGIYVKILNSSLVEVSTVQMDGIYTSGAKSITLDGSNLIASTTSVENVTGFNTLTDDTDYYFQIEFHDRAGNSITSFTSSMVHYVAVTVTCTITGYETNSGQPLNGYSLGDWQPIAYLDLMTNSSSATLSALDINFSGTASASDFHSAGIGLFYSTDSNFNVASDSQLGTGQPYSSLVAFTGLNQSFDSNGGFVFVAMRLSNIVDDTDNVSLSIDSSDITMNEDISFTGLTVTEKYLKPAVYTGYASDYVMHSSQGPYFRLDLSTNCGSTSITQLDIDISGSVVTSDFDAGSFKIWHSSNPTFSTSTATQIGTSKDFNANLIWTGLSAVITSTESYIFFTASLSDTAVMGHVIKATIPNDGISASGEYDNGIQGNFPIGEAVEGSVLPVELSFFNAVSTEDKNVTITWITETENGVSGYYLYRSATEQWELSDKINVMITNPVSVQNTQKTYSFTDSEVFEGYSYWYWLECVDIDGTTHLFGPVVANLEGDYEDGPPVIIEETAINTCYPNPFNPSTKISFNLAEGDNVIINIYDVRGKKVRDIINRYYDKGFHQIDWDGKDESGKSVSSGVYFIRMKTSDYEGVTKAMLLK